MITRTCLLILAFLFSLTLVTLAYSQSNVSASLNAPSVNSPTSGCAVGSQLPSTAAAKANDGSVIDNCGKYSGFIQGACCCDMATGELGCPNNPVCIETLKSLER